jgi:hypothetical protein
MESGVLKACDYGVLRKSPKGNVSDSRTRTPKEAQMNLPRMLVRHLISNFLLGAPLFVLLGCGKSVLTGGPIDGVVLDETNLQPIANARVVVKWHGVLPTIHSNSVPCYHVELATTDANGRYHITAGLRTKGMPTGLRGQCSGPILPVTTGIRDAIGVKMIPTSSPGRSKEDPERLLYPID